MMFAAIVFFASLILIVALFTIRYFEEKRGARFGARSRVLADNAALNFKDVLVHTREQMEKLPPEVAHVSMGAVHSGALYAASIARSFEDQAHRFADFVSSKRNFERRETKSEFLKGVSDYKNSGVDEDAEV